MSAHSEIYACGLEDLEELPPTDEEIACVRGQLDRLGDVRPEDLKVRLYLEQGENRNAG